MAFFFKSKINYDVKELKDKVHCENNEIMREKKMTSCFLVRKGNCCSNTDINGKNVFSKYYSFIHLNLYFFLLPFYSFKMSHIFFKHDHLILIK